MKRIYERSLKFDSNSDIMRSFTNDEDSLIGKDFDFDFYNFEAEHTSKVYNFRKIEGARKMIHYPLFPQLSFKGNKVFSRRSSYSRFTFS